MLTFVKIKKIFFFAFDSFQKVFTKKRGERNVDFIEGFCEKLYKKNTKKEIIKKTKYKKMEDMILFFNLFGGS